MKKILFFVSVTFFLFIPQVFAEEEKTFTDELTNLSFTVPIPSNDQYFLIIRSELCYEDNHSEGLQYKIYSSSEKFYLKSESTYYTLFSSNISYNWSLVQYSFIDENYSSCGVYDNLVFSRTDTYSDVNSDIRKNLKDIIVYHNFDIEDTSGTVKYPENTNDMVIGGSGDKPETPEEEKGFFEQLFDALELWFIPDPDDITFILTDLVDEVNEKLPFISDVISFFQNINDDFSPDENCDGDNPDCSYVHPSLNPFPRISIPSLGINNVELINTKFIDDNRYIIMNSIKAFMLLEFFWKLLNKIPHLLKGGN